MINKYLKPPLQYQVGQLISYLPENAIEGYIGIIINLNNSDRIGGYWPIKVLFLIFPFGEEYSTSTRNKEPFVALLPLNEYNTKIIS